MNDFNAYKKNVLLKALGFNTSQTINLFNGQQLQWLEKNETLGMDIARFFKQNNNSVVAKAFGKLAINAFIDGGSISFDYLLYNRMDFDNDTGDIDNNPIGGYDDTQYSDFDPVQKTWPNISPVISVIDFIGWNRTLHPTWECMEYCKAQITVEGYQISNYFNNSGQTIQVYTEQNGVNQIELQKGLSYLIYAMENGIPVIVGVDDHTGSPNPNTDNTTDHFVVIVGMGTDSNGKYFTFYDNASGKMPYLNYGANPNNKLYYYSNTGLITGKSSTPYFDNVEYDYILTQIRKSKEL